MGTRLQNTTLEDYAKQRSKHCEYVQDVNEPDMVLEVATPKTQTMMRTNATIHNIMCRIACRG